MKKVKNISFRCSKDLYDELKKEADKRGIDLTGIITERLQSQKTYNEIIKDCYEIFLKGQEHILKEVGASLDNLAQQIEDMDGIMRYMVYVVQTDPDED
jgi:arginyl-tRNA synthetase